MNEQLLIKYFSNTATQAERAMVREWATASADNMRVFCKEHNIYNALMLQSTESKCTSFHYRFQYRRQLLRIACVMLLVLTAGFGTFYGLFADRIVPIYTMTVPAGNNNTILLPDGSKVWLNAGSTIKYPASFIGAKRAIDIEGEAYLEVSKQRRPFIVRTPGGQVKVLGTKFYVTSTPDEEDFMVSLLEGSVELTAGNQTVMLKPGYRAEFAQGEFKQSVIRSFETELWKDGIYYFEDQSFADLMAGFEKCFGVNIEIDSSVENTERYTGKFYRYNGVQHALHALQYDFDFDYRWDKDQNTILITRKKTTLTTSRRQ